MVRAEDQEPFLKQLPEDLEALLVREMKHARRLRHCGREAAHVAEFTAHPFNELLVRRRAPRREAHDRRHFQWPNRNVMRWAMRECEWFARCGGHDGRPPKEPRHNTPVATREQ